MSAADRLLAASPGQWAAARRSARRLVVLAYHGVDDVASFAAQLDWLVRHRTPVTLDAAVDGLLGRAELPRHAVLLTFDDGERSVVEAGLPLLAERDVPGALYVVSDLVDTDRPYWWDEVVSRSLAGGRTAVVDAPPGRPMVDALKRRPDADRRAALAELRATAPAPVTGAQLSAAELRACEDAGVAIGNHSASHPMLAQCEPDVVAQELAVSHRRLTELLGHPPRTFAYPYGDVSAAVAAAVGAAGYEVAFAFDHRTTPVPAPDPLQVSRVRVGSTTPMDRFRILVSGLHPAIHHLRGRR